MKKKLFKTTSTLLLILCLYATPILKINKTLANANPSTLIVPDNFSSIQEAINNASSGDIIYVRKGTYQGNITINKSITLVGEDRENTIIDGGGSENVIKIQASNVNISNFTIRNSDPRMGCGIYIERFGNVVIANNNIRNNNIGIQITFFSSQNQICENMISANNIGIQLIYSGGNTICRNVIVDNNYGIDISYYSINNIIYENTISMSYVGIQLTHSSNNTICRNDIIENFDGIDIFYSMNNIIYENTFSGNNWGAYLSWSDNNVFYHNNFINNDDNANAEQTINTWSINGEGNYWDDYSGKDLNKDGIGDSPYNITEGNIDGHPLMGLYKTFVVSFSGNVHYVTIISNSSILNFTFKTMAETKARVILYNASIGSGFASFSRVVIPKVLMESVHAVFVNEEEVNVTLLNVEDVKNIYLYIGHFGNCSIKIVYSELLDWYYQLLSDYSELLDMYRGLNESYFMLLELNARLLEFNASVNILVEKFNDMNSLYKSQTQNLRGLIYIFAATTTIFILTTIYFSKKTHEKFSEPKSNAQ